jgi:hypothetical protein
MRVPCKKLESLCQDLRLHRVESIKIDVEGAELSVLRGTIRILRENPDLRIILELHDEFVKSIAFLEKEGFQVKFIDATYIIAFRSNRHGNKGFLAS